MGLWLNASKPESRLEGTTQPRRTLSGWTSIAARPPAPDGEQRPLTSTAPGAGRRPKRAPRPSGRPRHLLICPWRTGARSPADDLILGTGLVRSRAAPRCDLLRVSPVSKICSPPSLPAPLAGGGVTSGSYGTRSPQGPGRRRLITRPTARRRPQRRHGQCARNAHANPRGFACAAPALCPRARSLRHPVFPGGLPSRY